MTKPTSVIMSLPGTLLDDAMRTVIKRVKPVGFILFKRNCENGVQLQVLIEELKTLTPIDNPLILIDQEGGRVNRIEWEKYMAPAPRVFGEIYEKDKNIGLKLAELNGFLLGAQLAAHGINVNCLPLADVAFPKTDAVIGDRAYSSDPQVVADLCGATIAGLIRGGVWPVIKHAPGHGRATADSHKELPVVNAFIGELETVDYIPFKMNRLCPFVMTAHILYTALDKRCATSSRKVMDGILRQKIGMEGIIMSDDIGMDALHGSVRARASQALHGGCDLVLHCSGEIDEAKHLAGLPEISGDVLKKIKNLPQLGEAKRNDMNDAYDELSKHLDLD
jgi:beta-N-acetylhexosaminidase